VPVKRIIFSLLAIALVALAFHGGVDNIGQRYTDAALKRALITFGVARGMNAVISVAQGTEVAMEPAGVGVIFTPGQILDPVNDMIERFSWVMLASSTSLGLQGLLLKIFSSPVFSVLLVILVVAALLLTWWRQPLQGPWRTLVLRLAGMLLILRFMIPLMSLSSEAFYSLFLEPEYQASSAYLTETHETMGGLNAPNDSRQTVSPALNWLERLQGNVKGVMDSMDVEKHVAALQEVVRNLSEHIINLLVVFILQTILFPLLFLWLVVKTMRSLFRLQWSSYFT
jgi:hypothetical protein